MYIGLKKHGTVIATLLCAMLLIIGPNATAQAPADAVSIRAGEQFGGGYTISNGSACFVVTAAHVVTDADIGDLRRDIRVVGIGGTTRTAQPVQRSQTLDLALYRIDQPGGFNCGSSWNDGSRVRETVTGGDSIFLQKITEDGRDQRIFLDYETAPSDSAFIFLPRHREPDRQPRRGDSGSPIFSTAGALIGIATSIDSRTNDVTVLSQRAIDAAFASSLFQKTAVRMLVGQVVDTNGYEYRSATLSLKDALGTNANIILTERNPFYRGSTSWAGSIDPRFRGHRDLPFIPPTDYLMEVEVVSLNSYGRNIKRHSREACERARRNETGLRVLDSLISQRGTSTNFSNNEADRICNEEMFVNVISLDMDMRLIDTSTSMVLRHRITREFQTQSNDFERSRNEALATAINQGTQALLQNIGL